MPWRWQAVLGPNNNLADLLALFFRDDITAWSQRRQQRGGGWRHPQLKQLVDHNIDQCLKRMGHVAPSRPQEVRPWPIPSSPTISQPVHATWSVRAVTASKWVYSRFCRHMGR